MVELRKFEVTGEVNFWIRAENRKRAEVLAQSVIEGFVDGRLFKNLEVYNPSGELKNVIELKD